MKSIYPLTVTIRHDRFENPKLNPVLDCLRIQITAIKVRRTTAQATGNDDSSLRCLLWAGRACLF